MSGILAEKDGFEFQRWVETFNESYLQPFITEKASGKYRIDRFTTSGMYYLWYEDKNQYIEIKTSLDLTDKGNVTKLISSFDELIIEGKI